MGGRGKTPRNVWHVLTRGTLAGTRTGKLKIALTNNARMPEGAAENGPVTTILTAVPAVRLRLRLVATS